MVKIDASKCNGCCSCIGICPVDGVRLVQGKAVANEQCVECGSCIASCPTQAITLNEN
ncbi:MAG: 4Fe-4S binding protein [Candidatus Omnitrophota bacterium]|jgi:NAD-dependent dihydropyrimidine dehydrogenase PreA subunit